MKIQTIQQFFKQYPSDDVCLEHIMQVRYGLEGFCPKCGVQTKFSRVSSQRAYACQWCGWHTYPCVGTPLKALVPHYNFGFTQSIYSRRRAAAYPQRKYSASLELPTRQHGAWGMKFANTWIS